jgi:hypothetical protein
MQQVAASRFATDRHPTVRWHLFCVAYRSVLLGFCWHSPKQDQYKTLLTGLNRKICCIKPSVLLACGCRPWRQKKITSPPHNSFPISRLVVVQDTIPVLTRFLEQKQQPSYNLYLQVLRTHPTDQPLNIATDSQSTLYTAYNVLHNPQRFKEHYKGVGGEGKRSAPPGAPFRRISFSNIIGWGPSGLGKIAQH